MPTLPLPEAKDRVAQYLAGAGRAATRGARVVPLTGDASDRKYYRILPNEGDPFVLAVHAGAIDAETLPFVNVGAAASRRCRCRRRASSATTTRLGILALEDLGDVTLQAHLGSQPFQAHAALYRQAVAHIVTHAAARRRARVAAPTCPTASPSTSRS